MTRIVDTANRRPQVSQRIFRRARIERYSETIDPIIAEDGVRITHMSAAPGQVAGIRQVAQAWQHGRDVLSLVWQTSMGANQTYDAIVIDGTPRRSSCGCIDYARDPAATQRAPRLDHGAGSAAAS